MGKVSESSETYQQDHIDAAPPRGATRIHPTEKPVEALSILVRSYTPPPTAAEAVTVLDPFCGSGSCGEACVRTGRGFIGFEQDAKMAGKARGRLQRVSGMPRLEGPRAGEQMGLGW